MLCHSRALQAQAEAYSSVDPPCSCLILSRNRLGPRHTRSAPSSALQSRRQMVQMTSEHV
eukprot:3094873-Rhodomonas_salina.1